MEELSLIAKHEPGIAQIENFEDLKEVLETQLASYKDLVFSEDSLKSAKEHKKVLNDLRKSIDEKRKIMKKHYMQPYLEAEEQIKELIALIDEPLNQIKHFLSESDNQEKEQRKSEIEKFYKENSSVLGDMADKIFRSPEFYDTKWGNKTTSVKTYQDAVLEKIRVVSQEIQSIQSTGGKHTVALLDRYCTTFSIEKVTEYKENLELTEQVSTSEVTVPTTDEKVIGYKILKLTGTNQQLAQILDNISLLGIECEELEDGTPQDMKELAVPDFSSFVAFDIETSGTFGAVKGDGPAEITEIGAVKVVNGEIVDKFSMLSNPGRSIVPQIARLTHITNEMVENEPSINEVIQLFHEFVGDSILVGHNIKSSDIPYINTAAKRNGIQFENSFFDTYRYARQFKAEKEWKRVSLGYLSEYFGIELKDAHRAWCDAEANVEVYFKLKELGNV